MRRASGILLHITSLPSPCGIGDLGPWAYRFADFLVKNRQHFWQILPLTPSSLARRMSPYSGLSAFAGNKLLISPELLYQQGLLTKIDLDSARGLPAGQVDYPRVVLCKEKLLKKAFEQFKTSKRDAGEYEHFVTENAHWLDDFALFSALRYRFKGKSWNTWPTPARLRRVKQLASLRHQVSPEVELELFCQFVFFQQWRALKRYCNENAVQVIGDMPIYVDYDSVDVWAHPEIFKLNRKREPTHVAGTPPDKFTKDGQHWGNPVYHWDVLKETGYDWWVQRFRHNLQLFNMVRLDHFRGFFAFWEIPQSTKIAAPGRWTAAPGEHFFQTLLSFFPLLPVIAEDLGFITPDVREAVSRLGFPGMCVLQFAFDDKLPGNPFAPHNHTKNSVVFTGTHDNNTFRGWFQQEATAESKKRFYDYVGRKVPLSQIHWEGIRLAMMSVANLVIIPMQDVLGLDQAARMNKPGTTKGNWQWRLLPAQLASSRSRNLLEMTRLFGRA